MEYFEAMDTAMTEVREWEDYEADMATNPYSDFDEEVPMPEPEDLGEAWWEG